MSKEEKEQSQMSEENSKEQAEPESEKVEKNSAIEKYAANVKDLDI